MSAAGYRHDLGDIGRALYGVWFHATRAAWLHCDLRWGDTGRPIPHAAAHESNWRCHGARDLAGRRYRVFDFWAFIGRHDDWRAHRRYGGGFALGLRAEHPQAMVDEAQYGARCLDLDLPPAFYQLTAQTTMHGVYSFCMCPGGYIVPASTEPDRLVVNGMSLSRRDSPFANSGVVITVSEDDLAAWAYEQSRPGPSEDPLIGMTFQAHVEGEAYRAGGGQFRAPAQRIDDFVAGRKSQDLPATSYRRGIVPHGFDRIFPATILDSLRQALRRFDERLTGYLSHEGILVAPESRSSAPVRIQRHRDSLESTSHPGLYPCGEGAGFAGGIMSAALDGQKVAAAVVRNLS